MADFLGVAKELCIPWACQECCLCSSRLKTGSEALKHMKQVHRPWWLSLICKKCFCLRPTLTSLVQHATRCGSKKKSVEGLLKQTQVNMPAKYVLEHSLPSEDYLFIQENVILLLTSVEVKMRKKMKGWGERMKI